MERSETPLDEDATMTTRKFGATKLTLKDVREELRKDGMTIRALGDGEYEVYPTNRRALGCYYTSDLLDALETGIHMARERKPKAAAPRHCGWYCRGCSECEE